jgi:putative addiction module component (TIGR02574 family)
MTRQELLDTAKRLPKEDRIELAIELWDMIDFDENDFPLTEAQKAELDRRIAEADNNPVPSEDFEVLKQKLLRGEF